MTESKIQIVEDQKNLNERDNEKNGIDEEEAELYDRQIRLWGVEAQNRMRKSSVLVVNFKGLASETCKNIVLAGIKSVTILDDQPVSHEDLGAGFFFREEDLGKMRVNVALERVNSLNPRVDVIGITEDPLIKLSEPGFIDSFDVVCLCDSDPTLSSKVNSRCREAGKPFYSAGCLGMNGYIFVDLVDHNYLIERESSGPSGEIRRTSEKRNQKFPSFEISMTSKVNHVSPKRMKRISPMLWSILALFEYQKRNAGKLPERDDEKDELIEVGKEVLKLKGIDDEKILNSDQLKRLAEISKTEFVPTCSIVGSVLSQEILNVLGAHQAPIVNFFVFDGQSCSGDIYALGVERTS